MQSVKISRNWQEDNDAIYFSVTSKGLTGLQWIKHFKETNVFIGEKVEVILCSSDFKPTNRVKYSVVVLKGSILHKQKSTMREIEIEAKHRLLGNPNIEVACLIRDQFTNKEINEMGFYFITTMKPVKIEKNSDTLPFLLYTTTENVISPCLGAIRSFPETRISSHEGYAYVSYSVGPTQK